MPYVRRRVAPWGGALIAVALFLAHAAPGAAGDDAEVESAKVESAKHLRFQRTYEAALLEARIRNLPVLVSRHKDF